MLLLDSSPTLPIKSQVVARASMVTKPQNGVAVHQNKMQKSRRLLRHASLRVITKKTKLQTLAEENLESQSYGDRMSRVCFVSYLIFLSPAKVG